MFDFMTYFSSYLMSDFLSDFLLVFLPDFFSVFVSDFMSYLLSHLMPDFFSDFLSTLWLFFFFGLFRVLVRFFLQPAQTLWEFVDFQFVRECMKINKIRLKFHFLTKIEIKMTYLVFFFLCFTVSSPLELFGSRFIDV